MAQQVFVDLFVLEHLQFSSHAVQLRDSWRSGTTSFREEQRRTAGWRAKTAAPGVKVQDKPGINWSKKSSGS